MTNFYEKRKNKASSAEELEVVRECEAQLQGRAGELSELEDHLKTRLKEGADDVEIDEIDLKIKLKGREIERLKGVLPDLKHRHEEVLALEAAPAAIPRCGPPGRLKQANPAPTGRSATAGGTSRALRRSRRHRRVDLKVLHFNSPDPAPFMGARGRSRQKSPSQNGQALCAWGAGKAAPFFEVICGYERGADQLFARNDRQTRRLAVV